MELGLSGTFIPVSGRRMILGTLLLPPTPVRIIDPLEIISSGRKSSVSMNLTLSNLKIIPTVGNH